MKNIFYNLIRRGLISKESAVVLLAFTLTAGVYGFIVLTYFSSLTPSTSASSNYVVESVLLNYRSGGVWRIIISLSSSSPVEIRLSDFDVQLLVNGVPIPTSSRDVVQVGGGRMTLGSVFPSLTSGRVLVTRVVDGLTTSEYVDLFVYVDQGGRLNVVVDDDLDNVLDDSYLIRFQSNATSSYELNLNDDTVLSVGKGVTLPTSYLDFISILSSRPNPQIKVVYRDVTYLVSIADILNNLSGGVLTAWISGNDLILDKGERAYIMLLLPTSKFTEGSDLSIKMLVKGSELLSKSYVIPKGLSGSGTLIIS